MNKKKIYTVTAVILLIALYIVIFCFSAENGESSSDISGRFTQAILDLYHRIRGITKIPEGTAAGDVLSLEGIIRKLAHFGEYMCMGFLSYSLVMLWYRPLWRGGFLVVLQLLVSASLDEFHQYFVPGRNASIRDVMIDVAGGITGILIIVICQGIRKGCGFIRRMLVSSKKEMTRRL